MVAFSSKFSSSWSDSDRIFKDSISRFAPSRMTRLMNMNKHFSLFVIIIVALLATVTPAFAQQYGGQYGSTTTPSDLTVNKQVRKPLPPFDFFENLGENDLTYSPDAEVVFKISVTNSGNQTFEEVKVEDLFPEHIASAQVGSEFNGTYNSSDRRLTFYLKDLSAGETNSVEVTAKISKTGFASDKSLFCESNKVEVRSEDRFDDDWAQYCIRTNVLGVTTLPEAGLEDYLPMLPFISMGAVGMYLTLKKRLG